MAPPSEGLRRGLPILSAPPTVRSCAFSPAARSLVRPAVCSLLRPAVCRVLPGRVLAPSAAAPLPEPKLSPRRLHSARGAWFCGRDLLAGYCSVFAPGQAPPRRLLLSVCTRPGSANRPLPCSCRYCSGAVGLAWNSSHSCNCSQTAYS